MAKHIVDELDAYCSPNIFCIIIRLKLGEVGIALNLLYE